MVFGRKWAWFAKIFAPAQARPALRTPLHEILDPPTGTRTRARESEINETYRQTAYIMSSSLQLVVTIMHLCSICNSFAAATFSSVLRHIGDVHKRQNGPSPLVAVWCGIDGCLGRTKNYESFRSHVYKKHRHVLWPEGDSGRSITSNSGAPESHIDLSDDDYDPADTVFQKEGKYIYIFC